MDITNGPIHVFGNATQITNAPGQGQPASILVPDPNDDRGPSLIFAGTGILDIRYSYLKDKVAGFTGVVPALLEIQAIHSINQIPAAFQSLGLAGAQAVVTGVPMALAAASTGVTVNVPIIPFAGFGAINSGTVTTAAVALDFGFAFGTVVAATKQITVADTTKFVMGMPLVIGGVGNAAGTACLLTNVASIDSATLLTLVDAPQASLNPAPIGTGNLWGPSENGFPTPTAALPYQAMGPGLFLDPEQAVVRGVSVTGTAGGNSGGTFTVAGWDIYAQAMSETITVAAGASTGFGKKCFKYIASITPNFTDGANTYQAGTSDVVGFHMRSDFVELAQVSWNKIVMPDGVGWLAADLTASSPTTGDVRGTIQLSTANGGGTALTNQIATNGTVVSLAMSGRRLSIAQSIPASNMLRGLVSNTKTLFGNTQA